MKKYIKPNIKVVVLNEALAAPVTSDPVNPSGANAKDNTTEPTPVPVPDNSKSIWENG